MPPLATYNTRRRYLTFCHTRQMRMAYFSIIIAAAIDVITLIMSAPHITGLIASWDISQNKPLLYSMHKARWLGIHTRVFPAPILAVRLMYKLNMAPITAIPLFDVGCHQKQNVMPRLIYILYRFTIKMYHFLNFISHHFRDDFDFIILSLLTYKIISRRDTFYTLFISCHQWWFLHLMAYLPAPLILLSHILFLISFIYLGNFYRCVLHGIFGPDTWWWLLKVTKSFSDDIFKYCWPPAQPPVTPRAIDIL